MRCFTKSACCFLVFLIVEKLTNAQILPSLYHGNQKVEADTLVLFQYEIKSIVLDSLLSSFLAQSKECLTPNKGTLVLMYVRRDEISDTSWILIRTANRNEIMYNLRGVVRKHVPVFVAGNVEECNLFQPKFICDNVILPEHTIKADYLVNGLDTLSLINLKPTFSQFVIKHSGASVTLDNFAFPCRYTEIQEAIEENFKNGWKYPDK